MKYQLPRRDLVSFFLVIIIALAARLIFIKRFLIVGDEWYTIESAQNIGVSYIALPYFLLLHGVLKLAGLAVPLLRVISIFWGVLGVATLYLCGKSFSSRTVGTYAGLLSSLSPYLIMDHLEIRYYSFFYFGSALLLLAYLNFLKHRDKKSLFYAVSASLLGIFIHFNLIFLILGFGIFLFTDRAGLGRGTRATIWISTVLAGAAAIFIACFRQKIFSILLSLTFSAASTSAMGMLGWHWSNLIKSVFTLFCFVFGYNINPLNYATVLPFSALYAFLFFKGLVALKNEKAGGLAFWLILLVLPLGMFFGLAEPLATMGYQGVLSPKHAVFAYPVFIVIVSAGLASLRKTRLQGSLLAVLLTGSVLFLCKLAFPDYSYYGMRYLDFRRPSEFLPKLNLNRSLLVLDPHLRESFRYYNPGYEAMRGRTDPWEFLSLDLSRPSYDTIVFASDDWRVLNGGSDRFKAARGVYNEVFSKINSAYCVEDGFVQFPFYFYVFKKKDKRGCGHPSLPVETYGYEYADLKLPIQIGAKKILGSFLLGKSRPEWAVPIPKSKDGRLRKLSFICNLEGDADVPLGTQVAAVELVGKAGRVKIPLRKGVDVFDAFHEYEKAHRVIPGDRIVTSWEKMPLMSSSQRYRGSIAQFTAHLYQFVIDKEDLDSFSKIVIRDGHASSKLRIWGIFFE